MPRGALGFDHSYLVTENYYIHIQNPITVNFWRLFTQYVPGRASLVSLLDMLPDAPQKVCSAEGASTRDFDVRVVMFSITACMLAVCAES